MCAAPQARPIRKCAETLIRARPAAGAAAAAGSRANLCLQADLDSLSLVVRFGIAGQLLASLGLEHLGGFRMRKEMGGAAVSDVDDGVSDSVASGRASKEALTTAGIGILQRGTSGMRSEAGCAAKQQRRLGQA